MKEVPNPKRGEQYEFSGGQNVPIRDLASKMKFVGIYLRVLGVLQCLLVVATVMQTPVKIGILVTGIINIVLGTWTIRAATGFRKIVQTRGSDISHLMRALANLCSVYTLQYWLILFGLVVVGGLLAAMFLGVLV